MGRPLLSFEEKLWPNVDKSGGPDACWPYMRSKLTAGYGKFTHRHNQILAHRAAFYLTYGYMPAIVMHECDNPPCCNPAHLKSGTQSDNLKDMVSKDRHPWQTRKGHQRPKAQGSKNGSARLNEYQVKQIKQSSDSYRKLAAKFNVAKSTITMIKTGQTWKHV